MIQINPFKTNLNKDNDVCLICHCNLEDEQIYELPECSHKYHTDCIIQWFRSGNSNCPYCNSKFENSTKENEEEGTYYYRRDLLESKYKVIKKFSKDENCPKILITKIKSINKMQTDLSDLKKDLNKLMTGEGKWKEMQKNFRSLKSKIWRKQHSLYKKKKDLVSIVNIVPILVPKKIAKKKKINIEK